MSMRMDIVTWFDAIGPAAWLVALELKVAVLLASTFALSRLLRGASARLRYTLWRGALAGMLLVPVLSAVLPSWRVGLLPAGGDVVRAVLLSDSQPIFSGAVAGSTAGPATSALAHGQPASIRPPARQTPSAGTIILGAWLLGAVTLLVSLSGSLLRVRGLIRRGRRLDDASWAVPLGESQAILGIARPVRLVESSETCVPMTAGAFRPVVLLPPKAADWSEERRRLVLLHELTHVLRADWPLQVAGIVARALHWCNPLAWVALRAAGDERELSCDEGVLSSGAKPSVYARHLLEIADSITEGSAAPLSALAMARQSQLEGRFRSLLRPRAARRPSPAAAAAVLACIAAIVIAVAVAEPGGPAAAAPAAAPQANTASRIQHDNGRISVERRFEGGLLVSFVGVGISHDGLPASIERLPRGASVRLSSVLGSSTRDLSITAAGDGPTAQIWQVDGTRRPFDDAARRWRDLVLQIVSQVSNASNLRGEESSLRGEISSIRGGESSLRGEISSIRGEESSLRGEISSIRGKESSLRGEISSIRGEESSLRGEISSIRGEESSLRGRLSGLASAPGDHADAIRRAQQELQALDVDGRVRAIEREIEKLDVQGKIGDIERQIRELDVQGKVREVERLIQGLDGEGMRRKIENQIVGLEVEGKIREIERVIEGLDVDGQVRAIEERLRPLVEELRKLMQQR
jgi:beta-lactamase regulating signal transducer with metallopeptidase domain